MKTRHKLKLRLAKIVWYFKILGWAQIHHREVDNYKFLLDLKNIAHNKMLEMEREKFPDKAEKLKIQINLIDKILNYVKPRTS